jgi:hypothetical protein
MAAAFDQLAADNKALREAVAARMDATPDTDPTDIDDPGEPAIPVDWILRGERELKAERERPEPRPLGAGVMSNGDGTPAERLLLDALDAVRDRRGKYGPPINHFSITVRLVNACFGTSFTESDWATIMVLDKIARSRGPMDCRDNDVDLAGYAACRAECRRP